MDLSDRPYPQPVTRIQALLEEDRRGPLAIILSDDMSATAVSALLTSAGLITRTYRQDNSWLVLGRKADAPEILVWYGPEGWQAASDDQAEADSDGADLEEAEEEEAILDLGPALSLQPSGADPPPKPGKEPPVVLVGGQVMGAGEDALGARLATAFFDVLAGLDPPPSLLAFYNTGVFLTTRDSAVVEALRDLAGRGAIVISSGLCLEHFGLKGQLKVGRLGNVYEIVKAQLQSARVIRL